MLKSLHSLGSCAENFILIQIASIYLSFSPGCDLNARQCFDGPAAPQQGMLGALIVWWPASFWLQWTMAEGTVHTGSPAKFPTKPTEEWIRKMYAIKQIKICAEYRTCYPGLGWICQVHLGFGISASAQVPDKPALAWVACPGILHRS